MEDGANYHVFLQSRVGSGRFSLYAYPYVFCMNGYACTQMFFLPVNSRSTHLNIRAHSPQHFADTNHIRHVGAVRDGGE